MGDKIVYIIIGVTGVVTYLAWQNKDLFQKLLLSPYDLVHKKQYYRVITHGFLHANWPHLIINMLVFWSFGSVLMQYFYVFWGEIGFLLFLLLYISSLIVSSLFSIAKHRDDYSYSAVGASGATSAIVFASIFFDPWNKIYFFGILPIPGIVFGVLYLIYTYRMSKKGTDNIGHDAHLWGALYGFVFPLILKPQLWEYFVHRIMNIW